MSTNRTGVSCVIVCNPLFACYFDTELEETQSFLIENGMMD